MLEGSCHCGSVRIHLAEAPTEATDCNCSICRRLGGWWSYFHPLQVRIDGEDEATFTYIHGDRTLALHHCRTCGCTTHWRGLDPAHERMGINMRMFEPPVTAALKVRPFDGADTWTFLDEAGR